MKTKIINYEELEKPILKLESVLSEYDAEEKALIVKFIVQRIAAANQRVKMNEAVQGLDLRSLISRVRKQDDTKED